MEVSVSVSNDHCWLRGTVDSGGQLTDQRPQRFLLCIHLFWDTL